MSRLDELIAELCPDGVEIRELKNVIISLNTGLNPRQFFKLNTDDAENFYVTIKEMHGGKVIFSDKTDKINDEAMRLCNNRSNLEKGDVLFSGTGTIGETVVLYETPQNWNIKEGVYTIKPNPLLIDSGYLSHLLGSSEIKNRYMKKVAGGTVKSIPMAELKKLKLPVPPLEVQREIVHILDSFTLLTAELTAELTARKKQYEFYRDTLLKKNCKSGKVKLNTVCEIYDGTHQTPQYTNSGVPFVSVENIDDLYGTQKFISQEAYEKYKIKPRIGDVFMTRITAGVIGKCTVVDRNDDLAYYVSLALLRPNADVLDSKYLKYYLESRWGRKELGKWILWDATPTKINKDDIGRALISVPPLDTQKRLVQVIEHFDAICTD